MTVLTVQPSPVEALAALFDNALPAPVLGEPLPALWHWVALPRWSAYGATGPDGHPRPLDLPAELHGRRRMFAGGRVDHRRPLHVGERVKVHEELGPTTLKQGRKGSFALVTQRTTILDESGAVAIEEERDLVYRDSAPVAESTAAATAAATAPPRLFDSVESPRVLSGSAAGWRFRTDPVALMRFSSATANAHRIHYDWPYATRTEGYPDLVVHGPLVTLTLLEVARLTRPDFRPERVVHRNTGPLFCGQEGAVTVEPGDDADLVLTMTTGGAGVAEVRCEGSARPA